MSGRLHIGLFLPNLGGGGAERVAHSLAGKFARRAHRVDLVLMNAEGPYLDEPLDGVRVIDLKASKQWLSYRPLVNYLADAQPEVLLSFMPIANGVAGWARRKGHSPNTVFVGSEHSKRSAALGNWECWEDLILRGPIRAGYRGLDGMIAVSAAAKRRIQQLDLLEGRPVTYIHNPLAEARVPRRGFKRRPPLSTNGTGPDRAQLLAAGRLERAKDYPTMLRAMARLKELRPFELTILGEGSQRDELEALVEHLGLTGQVRLVGFVDDPRPWYEEADLFVMSSIYEGFGNVVVEALAHGLPVVSTDCGGPREILAEGRFGRLVPPGDPRALAATIDQALSAPHDHSLLSARGEEFSLTSAADAYLAFFDQLLGQRAPERERVLPTG